MSHSVYGFSRSCFGTSEYLDGPRRMDSALNVEAKAVIATLIYVLSEKPKDEFMLGAIRPSDCDLVIDEIITYCLFSVGLERRAKECPWSSEAPEDRAVCVDYLFARYSDDKFDWYHRPGGFYGVSAPLLAGLQAFVSHHRNIGIWSCGQTLDMAILFRTLLDFFDSWEREGAKRIADDLRPYATAFERFSAEGCYAIKVDDVPPGA